MNYVSCNVVHSFTEVPLGFTFPSYFFDRFRSKKLLVFFSIKLNLERLFWLPPDLPPLPIPFVTPPWKSHL